MIRRQLLVAFDFDHTIIEENSDIVARKLINVDLIPEQVRRLYQTKGWMDYMAEIFKLLHKHKVSKETIIEAMHKMTPTQKMPELLQWLKSGGHETIIISDSNSVFIEEWLQNKQLLDCVQHIFTNPAIFQENGLLTIEPYHDQDWCDLSTRNLCKGHILESYIKTRQAEKATFDALVYVGDGLNDFCPALRLSKNDFVFPRAGLALDNIIHTPTEERKVKAKVNSWVSAADIINTLENFL